MLHRLQSLNVWFADQVGRKRSLVAVIALVVIAGLVLRLWGISFGLPCLYDPDESLWVARALRMLRDRDPNPHWFGHPGTTTMYMLSAIYAAIFGIRLALGTITGPADLEALYYRDPTAFYLSGRLLIVLSGTATILAVYMVARRLSGRAAGLVAATVLALSPAHVLYSKLIRGDVKIGFLMLVSLWFCLNVVEDRKRRDYLAAGFVTGLAVVTKYTAAVFVASIVWAHLEAVSWQLGDLRKHIRLLVGGVACLGGAFLGSPFLFLDFQTTLSDVALEARPTHLSATGEGFLRNLLWYLREPLPDALTWPGLVLAGLGIIWFASRGRKKGRLVASTPVFVLLFISSLSLRWDHWIVPAIPFLCIPLACAIALAAEWVRLRIEALPAACVTLGLLLVVIGPLLLADMAQGQALSRPDTRTLTAEWMLANLTPGSHVLMEAVTPQLPRDVFVFHTVDGDGTLVRADPADTRHRLFYPTGSVGGLKDDTVLAEEHIRYVVMSNRYDRYLAEVGRYETIVAGYHRIMDNARLIYEIPGCKLESAYHSGGPPIRIYEIE